MSGDWRFTSILAAGQWSLLGLAVAIEITSSFHRLSYLSYGWVSVPGGSVGLIHLIIVILYCLLVVNIVSMLLTRCQPRSLVTLVSMILVVSPIVFIISPAAVDFAADRTPLVLQLFMVGCVMANPRIPTWLPKAPMFLIVFAAIAIASDLFLTDSFWKTPLAAFETSRLDLHGSRILPTAVVALLLLALWIPRKCRFGFCYIVTVVLSGLIAISLVRAAWVSAVISAIVAVGLGGYSTRWTRANKEVGIRGVLVLLSIFGGLALLISSEAARTPTPAAPTDTIQAPTDTLQAPTDTLQAQVASSGNLQWRTEIWQTVLSEAQVLPPLNPTTHRWAAENWPGAHNGWIEFLRLFGWGFFLLLIFFVVVTCWFWRNSAWVMAAAAALVCFSMFWEMPVWLLPAAALLFRNRKLAPSSPVSVNSG